MSALRIGTRGSALALAQAGPVAAAVAGELVVVRTAGDRGTAVGDKSRWVQELEDALLGGEIDIAVHSAKDVPADLPEGLALLAAGPRAEPRDALVGAPDLAALPPGARVGTSSLRREAQLRAARVDLEVVPLRGNVDTRLGKLAAGECDAAVLAAAGLARLDRSWDGLLDVVPAAGQGIVVLEGRVDDARPAEAGRQFNHPPSERALTAERALVRTLGATCHSALGAHADPSGGVVALRAWLGKPDGSAWLTDELTGMEPGALGEEVARRMLAAGAAELLDVGMAARAAAEGA
ncbi:MAG TPA: hydroxymethylbilane synthase [Solirubrobacteraceae bacterium]